MGDTAGKNEVFHETETIENEVQTAIEEGQNVMKNRTATTAYTSFTGNATTASNNRLGRIREARTASFPTTETVS